jgi:hypothetical protein
MLKLPPVFAAAAISGLALAAAPGNASPLAASLTSGSAVPAEIQEGLVQEVHGWHCRRKFSHRRGWHRHRRACGYSYYYPHYGPTFSFGLFIDDDDGRRHRRKFRRHRRDKDD